MIYHFIRFQFPGTATAKEVQTFVKKLDQYKDHPDAKMAIVGRIEDPHVLVNGRNVGDLEGGYTHGLLMVFEDDAAYERYVVSPEFRDSREEGVPLCEKVAGFDFIDDWDEGTPARIRALRAKRSRLSTDDGHNRSQ